MEPLPSRPRTELPQAPQESPTTLFVNNAELLTIQTTPQHLGDWARGFLFSEGLINSPGDLKSLVADEEKGLVWAEIPALATEETRFGERRYLTSGCGKGVTFSSVRDAMNLRPVSHGLCVTRAQLAGWMRLLGQHTPLYDETGGMHAAMAMQVATGRFLVREDIGRHNAVDKALGAALAAGWHGEGLVVLTSGRISYEMCAKLVRHGVAVGASRTAVTDQAMRLALATGVDLVGYVRGNGMTLYTIGSRIMERSEE